MKVLIRRIAKGIPYPHAVNMRMHPERTQKSALDASADMKETAKLLKETNEIIVELTCNNTTFNHHETTLQ